MRNGKRDMMEEIELPINEKNQNTRRKENLGSIPGRVIPKTQKWYLMPPCLKLSIIR